MNILPLFKTAKFYWFSSHLLSILCAVVQVITSFVKPSASVRYYNYSFNFIIITYLILLSVSIKSLRFNWSTLRNDNVQYLVLALVLRSNTRYIGVVNGGLYPFVIYGLFHVMGYIRTTILPCLSLPTETRNNYGNLLLELNKQYYEKSLLLGASSELFILLPFIMKLANMFLLLGLFRNRLSYNLRQLFVSLVVVVFVKLRYNQSKNTQAIVNGYDLRINQLMFQPMVPVQVREAYAAVKGTVLKYVGAIRIPSEKKVK